MAISNVEIAAIELTILNMSAELLKEQEELASQRNQLMQEVKVTADAEHALTEETECLENLQDKLNMKEHFYTELENRVAQIESENATMKHQIKVMNTQNEAVKVLLHNKERELNCIRSENQDLGTQLLASQAYEKQLTEQDGTIQASLRNISTLFRSLESEQENFDLRNDLSNNELIREICGLRGLLERESREKLLLAEEVCFLKAKNEQLQRHVSSECAAPSADMFHGWARRNFEDVKKIVEGITESNDKLLQSLPKSPSRTDATPE